MLLMVVLGALMVLGIVLALWWGGTPYREWNPDGPGDTRSAKAAARKYLRGVAIALVGGFWTGLLLTGPAMRLIMRLLAVTGGDDAQGRITEAEEIVGVISVGGTIGLIVFGGILPGLLSGGIYVLVRRWLPGGRLGGIVFGAFHLLLGATRIDPLRPENPDFDLVGPGWLSVLTFGLACVLHGMAVAAIANRYSTRLPPEPAGESAWVRPILPLLLPGLLLIPGALLLLPLAAGLLVAVILAWAPGLVRWGRSRGVLVGGRVLLAVVALVFLPATLADLWDIVDRDQTAHSIRSDL